LRVGSGTFQGEYADTPSGTSTGTPTAPSGTALYGFEVPHDATWHVWVRVYGPNAASNEWYQSLDGGARSAFGASANSTWEWVEARSAFLTAGLHDFELGGFEARARADRILITDDPNFLPTESPVGDTTPPASVSNFAAGEGSAEVDLSWDNPADADFVKTVVRYRTDGRYPTSPHDGSLAAERPAAPGSADGFTHGGLTNGTTYSYSAFAIDADGNVADAANVEATT
jgi:hypothetical protein